MTIVYQGIRRKTTDVLDDYGQGQYLQNVRLKRVDLLIERDGAPAELFDLNQKLIGKASQAGPLRRGHGSQPSGKPSESLSTARGRCCGHVAFHQHAQLRHRVLPRATRSFVVSFGCLARTEPTLCETDHVAESWARRS